MMNEQTESLNTELNETNTTEGHTCTDGHACIIDHEEELVAAPASSVSVASTSSKKHPMRLYLFGAIGLVVLGAVGLTGFVYTHASTDKTVVAITKNIPFPAITVGRAVITYSQYTEERDALTKYFATQQGDAAKPSPDQFNQLVVDTLVNKAVVKTLATNYGVTLDQTKIEDFYKNIISSSPSEDTFKKQLQDTFGWSVADFKHRIVESVVLSQQVSDYVAASKSMQQPKRDLIEKARTRVSGGEDFAKVATDVHTQAQVTMKSDLGLIKITDLPATWSDQVKNLEKGKVSDVVDLPQGYALFMVTDHVGKGADEQLHLMAMTVPKVSLQSVVADYLKNVTVKTLIKV